MTKVELEKIIRDYFRMIDRGRDRITKAYADPKLSSAEKQAIEDEAHSNPYFTDSFEEYHGAKLFAEYLLDKIKE